MVQLVENKRQSCIVMTPPFFDTLPCTVCTIDAVLVEHEAQRIAFASLLISAGGSRGRGRVVRDRV